MMRSLFIKLALLLAATAAIFWIGWDGPHGPEATVKTGPPVGQSSAGSGSRYSATPPSVPLSSQSARRHEPTASLDLNRATAEELTTLPGVGKVLADRIVQKRETSGLYGSIQELLDVRGIGEKRLARIRPRVHVSSDRATASAQVERQPPGGTGRPGS